MSTLVTTETIERPTRTPRPAQRTRCPSCGTRAESAGTTVKCGSCGLVAPLKAFLDADGLARTWGRVRAFTISGKID